MNTVQEPHSHIPFGEEGSGYYSDNTIGCYNVINAAESLTLNAIEHIPFNTKGGELCKQTFTFADYGTADGGTSLPLIRSCVKALRKKYGSKINIHIIYEDQPTNDFKSLFLRLNGLIPGPPSYFLEDPNIFVSACGTGFYQQCFPPESIELGFSATAMHWLQKKPCNITGALHHTMVTDEAERLRFVKQAAEDWETILLRRANELKEGGYLVLVQFAVDEEGQFLGKTKNIKHSMHEVMRNLWQQMVKEGKINEEEFQNTTFINYYRTIEEYKKPFKEPDSPVMKSGLRLISVDTKVVRCPYHDKWMREGGDSKAHAKWYVPTTRTWSNSTFLSALSENRTEEEKKSLVDNFFLRYENEVAANPSDHGMDYVHVYLVIKKDK